LQRIGAGSVGNKLAIELTVGMAVSTQVGDHIRVGAVGAITVDRAGAFSYSTISSPTWRSLLNCGENWTCEADLGHCADRNQSAPRKWSDKRAGRGRRTWQCQWAWRWSGQGPDGFEQPRRWWPPEQRQRPRKDPDGGSELDDHWQ
jgi:hypothetical protein